VPGLNGPASCFRGSGGFLWSCPSNSSAPDCFYVRLARALHRKPTAMSDLAILHGVCGRRPARLRSRGCTNLDLGSESPDTGLFITPSGRLSNLAVSRPTDAGQQPPHYLSVRIVTGRQSFHRLLSEGLGLLFGLSLVLRKRHPFADDFAARLVFRLHAHSFTLNGGRRQHKGRVRCLRSRQGDEDTAPSVGGIRYCIVMMISLEENPTLAIRLGRMAESVCIKLLTPQSFAIRASVVLFNLTPLWTTTSPNRISA
jgi:hypothetical protein